MKAPARLDAIDVVRVLTVALVIGVHAVWLQPGGTRVAGGATLVVMHVSREVFFLLTAFVLSYSYRDRAPARWSAFWRRRYLLVGVPYLVWSAVYLLAAGHRPAVGRIAVDLATGAAQYHLYFLLVTMQMYLVFPLLRRLVHATRGRHGLLLAAAAGYQLAVYAAVQLSAGLPDPSPYLPAYLGFVVAGAVAADHAERFLAWTGDRARWIAAGCAASVAAGVAVYFVQLAAGLSAAAASAVFQPVVVVESVAIAWTFLAAGLVWQRRGMPARRLVRAGADASFGVYLGHPLLLQGLLAVAGATGLTAAALRLPDPLVTAVLLVVVVPLAYLTCAVLAEAARRTPLSLPLTGRRRPTPAPVPVSPPPAPTSGGLRCERQPA